MTDLSGFPGGLPGRLVDALSREQDKMNKAAKVLHEDVGQVLTVVGFHLDVLRQDHGGKAPEIAESTKLIQKLLEKAIEDVRKVSYQLNSDIVQRSGLRYALNTLIGRLRESTGATIRLLLDSKVHVPMAIAPAVFAIAEQAVGNALAHSQGDKIEVVLQPVHDGVRLEIRDNGIGFDLEQTRANARGIGLVWMQHISAKAGLQLQVSSKAGQGTIVQATYRAPQGSQESTREPEPEPTAPRR
jgi:signal transduction histidine kinase